MKKLVVLWLTAALVWAAEPPFAPALEESSYEDTDKLPAHSVRLAYPRTQAALDLVLKQKAEYENTLGNVKKKSGPRSLQVDYEIVYADERLVSVYFHGARQFGDGKARPLQKALLLSPKGAEIKLAREFRPGDGWLKALADHCRVELLKKGVTAPNLSDQQFQTMLPQADGLRVIFEEYKIAPEAYEMLVPWSVLKSEILPNGCLAFALSR